MIINVIGPIAVGKSTFCKKFVEKYPEFVHVAIDDCRLRSWKEAGKKDLDYLTDMEKITIEETAWMKLFDKIKNNRHVILETSGLSWRMKGILHYDEFVRRGIYTIKFVGTLDKCLKRLRKRVKLNEKPKTPFFYEYDEEEGLKFLHRNIHRAPHNLLVHVDLNKDYDRMFSKIEKHIVSAKLRYDVKGTGNNAKGFRVVPEDLSGYNSFKKNKKVKGKICKRK